MSKTLLLLRHAKSSWDDPGLGDHDRPLNKRGRKASTKIGQLIEREAFPIDLILCSTSARTRETIDRILTELRHLPKIEYLSELYCASPGQIIRALNRADRNLQCVMVIAHNPGLEDLLTQLTGEQHHFPTAALASIEFQFEGWEELTEDAQGRLNQLWRPRDLDHESP